MKLLLDTHALIWWLAGKTALTAAARAAMDDADNIIFVSAVSAFEVSLKHKLGKLDLATTLVRDFAEIIARQGFVELPVSARQASLAGALDLSHKDPFDRLLIAQSLVEGLTLVSNEKAFDRFGVNRLW